LPENFVLCCVQKCSAFIYVSDLQPKQAIKRLQSDCTLFSALIKSLYKANVIADDDGCPDNSDTPVGAAATVATDDHHRYTNSESDTQDTNDDVDENYDDADAVDDDNDDGEMSLSVISRSAQTIVMRNLCGVIYQLSAYPTLTVMYKFLSSVAVSICSAERCLSCVRIVENRLRSQCKTIGFRR
jgi:hypothetical protein